MRQRSPRPPELQTAGLWSASVLIGVLAGLATVVFRGLIALVHNLLFLGQLSLTYRDDAHTPQSPWGPLVILVPVVGGLGVAFLVKRYAPRAKGPGVAESIEAIHYRNGVIRPVTALIKTLASSLSVGSGASVGREGPIIHIGASLGSMAGQAIRMPVWQRTTLMAAGAAGGIAATFDTPIGGILFAIEIMMRRISPRTVIPVAIAAATAAYVSKLFLGPDLFIRIPSFERSGFQAIPVGVLLSYVGLGLLMGLVSWAIIRAVYGAEAWFRRLLPGRYPLRHGIATLLVGVTMYLLMLSFGHYYIQGVGYATVHDALTGELSAVYLLLLLGMVKLAATAVSLGSGAAGGVFSPSLFIGATLGAAYAHVLNGILPGQPLPFTGLAVAGMAALVGGVTGAALTTIVMVFEMTHDYNVLVPMMIAVLLAYELRRKLLPESIYTWKLARRGHRTLEPLMLERLQSYGVEELMDRRVEPLPASTPVRDLPDYLSARPDLVYIVVTQGQGVVGIAPRAAALRAAEIALPTATLEQIASRPALIVPAHTDLVTILTRMGESGATLAVVAKDAKSPSAADVLGVVADHDVLAALGDLLDGSPG